MYNNLYFIGINYTMWYTMVPFEVGRVHMMMAMLTQTFITHIASKTGLGYAGPVGHELLPTLT